MKFESQPQFSEEELKKLGERNKSDTDFIKGGAEYVNAENVPRLSVTDEQIEQARMEMGADFAIAKLKSEISELNSVVQKGETISRFGHEHGFNKNETDAFVENRISENEKRIRELESGSSEGKEKTATAGESEETLENTEEEKQEKQEEQEEQTEQEGLGIERVKDPEKAHLMASLENLAYEQAGSYKHYLEKPESHTVEETVEFSIWKAFNYSPADIRSIGQENAEIAGEKYDIEKIVQEYETKKSRFGLAKEQIMAVFNIASSHIKFAFRWWPHIIGFKEPKGSNKIVELRRFFKNFDLESHRFLVADEAARNLGGTGRKEYTAQILDEEAKEALLKAEKYELPKSPKQKRSDEKPQSEEGEKNEVVADTFEWIYKKYKEYLSLPEKEKRRQSYYFRNLEERGIKLEDLKDQEKTLTEWLGRLKVYGKRLENLTEDELRREMKFSFLTSVTKQVFENSEKKSGSEVLLDLGVSVFKTYKAASELEKRKFLRAS